MPSGASSGKSWVPPGASSYVSCVSLGGSWVSLGLRHMRLGCLLVHRRMSLVCILVDPWCLWDFGICVLVASLGHRRMALVCLLMDPGCFRGFVTCVMGASWVIIVCVFCVPLGWSWGPSDASSYTSCVPIDTSSYVSCVPPGWALDDTVASSGKSRVPLGTPFYVSCVPLGGAWAPTGLRHMRPGCLLGHRRMSLVCLLVNPRCLRGFVICVLGASCDVVVCFLCASWLVLGAYAASSHASWGPLGTSLYVSCVPLGGSWVLLGLRHLRLGCFLVHRRMFLVCLLFGAWVILGLRPASFRGPWYIVGCFLCASG